MRMAIVASLMATACGAAWGARPAEMTEMAEEIVTRVAINSDAEFFDAWNLDRPGMEEVKAAVEAQDYAAARVALKEYFLARREPVWRVNHWEMPAEPQGRAEDHSLYARGEDILAHKFSGGGFEVDFGEKIDWNYFPLKLANGNPDTEYPIPHYINRFGHLRTLGRLYWFSHDEKYAREFVAEITDHVLSNPAPEKYIRFTSVWSRLTAAVPLLGSWLDAWNYFLPSENFTPDAVQIMLRRFIEKARYAIVAPDGVNRYMAQLGGVYNVGAYFPELKQAEDFRRYGLRGMVLAARDEFYPDGMSKELCPGYHGGSRGAIDRIINNAALMGCEHPEIEVLEDAVRKSWDVYEVMSTPLLGLPQFGDTWGLGDLSRWFGAVTGRWGDPVHEWFASDRTEGAPPPFTSARLPWAGLYFMRSGWDERALYLAFDAGPVGLGHFHEDYGNFECYAFGERLISDVGVNSYTVNKWHNYCYSSLAHNVVIVDGLSQARAAFGEEHPWVVDEPRSDDWHSDEVFDLAWGFLDAKWTPYSEWVGWSNHFGRDAAVELATHRRDVCFVRGSYWIISDRLAGEGEHTYEQLFHLRPDRTAEVLSDRSAGTTDTDRPNIVLIQADPVPAEVVVGREEPPQGWVAVKHGEMEPAPCIVFRQVADGGAAFDTVLLPLDVGRRPQMTVERMAVTDGEGSGIAAADVCALRIETPEGVDLYLNDLRQAEIGPANGQVKTAGELRTDARAVVVRMDADGRVVAASAAGGSFVTLGERDVWGE
ncbi:MAG: alginate lyase family protein [Armatimonadetes bacterium]|nr:alginate lyase family protein [Armatimonadota bacterium]